MGIPENIRRLRELHDLTQDELGAIAGVTGKAVWTWEAGTATPRMAQFQHMADHFGYPKSVLIDDAGMWRVDPETGKVFRGYVPASTSDIRAPLYGSISAGKPVEEQPVSDHLWVPPDLFNRHPRAFYLRLDGESMNRRYPNGSFVLVDPDAQVLSGDPAAVNVNGYDATVKIVLKGSNSITLAPDSYDESFEDERYDQRRDGESVTLIGRVIWHLPPYDAMVQS